ncbi:MAG TPA: NAD(P)/FAD-dependent oxidoreductase [Firmicutes bacterium]|jgi:predicted Rossmann fold flavoprotein|nr:NAD(P)/FAD-dependent oxidoreductase [Bacillota bacterium]HOQ24911.1 NAD(P)/FAD-dependent oxidoreductase [Bacillota bacterium]HPT68081.1 NAD(P)/FAD-dependent oxidoreductase [Bacillota bacterium]
MKAKKRVIVVGGGAAGMMAAISARRLGADVTILERNPRVGKKLLATGNGRCNFTNIQADVTCYYGQNPEFARAVLAAFPVAETIRFFEKLGIEHKVEEAGKVFPLSDQASSVLDVLLYELRELGVNIICDACVKTIAKQQQEFVVGLENGAVYLADRVILTTGGKAMPASGSDGSGYELAQQLGHSVTALFPALVQLKLDGPYFKRIEGVKIVGTAEIIHGGQSLAKDRGDILFGNYGVSGPPIFQLSRKAGELLNEGREAYLKITIMDMFAKDELRAIISRRFQVGAKKPVDFSLVGLVNKRLIPVLLLTAGISDFNQRRVADLIAEEVARIVDVLTDWRFRIRGTKGWPNAQVTAGGVATREIDESTMESKLVPGLFFAGEIVDIDGQCGGFNLQWAWSSGFVAGRQAAL